jgi:hypothetical protein
MSPLERFVKGPLQDRLKPQRYIQRWLKIYAQWEFWALSVAVIGIYYLMEAQDWLPTYLREHRDVGKALVTAIIMLPLPWLVRRKDRWLRGRDDFFKRFWKHVTLSGYIVPIISLSLLVSVLAYLGPAFIDPTTKQPLTGWTLMWQQPITGLIPLLFLVSAAAVQSNYGGWRWTAALWTLGGYFATWAAVFGFTDVETDITGYRQAFTAALMVALTVALAGFLLMSEEAAAISSRKRLTPFWPFSRLGDNWTEAIMNLLLLVILSPVLAIVWVWALAWSWLALVLRFPEPECIPAIVLNDHQPPEASFDQYAEAFHEVAGKLPAKLTFKAGSLAVNTAKARVELWHDDEMVGISIDGLDTRYWHTLEAGNIDEYFWIAVGALRSGIKHKRNKLGRREGWVYCDEMSIWAVVSAADSSYSYLKYRHDG